MTIEELIQELEAMDAQSEQNYADAEALMSYIQTSLGDETTIEVLDAGADGEEGICGTYRITTPDGTYTFTIAASEKDREDYLEEGYQEKELPTGVIVLFDPGTGTTVCPESDVPTDPPETEPPVTEPPVTEPPVTEPPVTEPPVTEPPVTEPPVTEPTEPAPTDPLPTEPAPTQPKPTVPKPTTPTPTNPNPTPGPKDDIIITPGDLEHDAKDMLDKLVGGLEDLLKKEVIKNLPNPVTDVIESVANALQEIVKNEASANESYRLLLKELQKRLVEAQQSGDKDWAEIKNGRDALLKYQYKELMRRNQLEHVARKLFQAKTIGKILGGAIPLVGLYGDYKSLPKMSDQLKKVDDVLMACIDDPNLPMLKELHNKHMQNYNIAKKIGLAGGLVNDLGGAVLTKLSGALGFGISFLLGILFGMGSTALEGLSDQYYDDFMTMAKLLPCYPGEPEIPGKFDKSTTLTPTYDPSGYVYEAVPSNRLEGVKAEVYYLDENGEEVLWNAADYDQINPQYTDADGRYQWDVPFGLWLVKYTRSGYLDADSRDDPAANADGYLPVPPPQLDVNVGMVSTAVPEVESLNVYQDQIQVIFSQYMKPDTVALSVDCGGETVTGTLEPVNSEFNEEQTEQFAAIFAFTPDTLLEGTANVTISGARNYAGTQMSADFAETRSVTVRPTGIAMAEEAELLYGESRELKIRILPAAAGAGKMLTVTTSAPGQVDVLHQTVTADADGTATVTVCGTLPGNAIVTAMLDGTDLESSTMFRVVLSREEVCARVTASIPSGSTVEAGTELALFTETEGAEIYYTLDGTCPCVVDSPSRFRYTGPIVLTEDTFLIAYAVKEGFADSPTAGFLYTVQTVCSHANATRSGSTEASCTADGYTGDLICDDCGAVLEEGEVVPATGHSFTEHRSNGDATCTEDGTKTATCTRCGITDTVTDTGSALGHDFTAWSVVRKPTETETGLEERTCVVCGHTEQRTIASLENPFTDVQYGSFYYEPVMWAIENGITNGTSATTFGPNDQCMRAHVVTFLWRAVGSPEPTSTQNPFVDVKPADFYYKPVLWALENGITSGMDATHFGPTAYCNRAQVVTFLYRTMESPAVTSAENPFTDVPAGQWFTAPVLWAVENGITNGLSATSFGPNAICNRAQIVTFLYRAFVND